MNFIGAFFIHYFSVIARSERQNNPRFAGPLCMLYTLLFALFNLGLLRSW
jgi:hypothetical protein